MIGQPGNGEARPDGGDARHASEVDRTARMRSARESDSWRLPGDVDARMGALSTRVSFSN